MKNAAMPVLISLFACSLLIACANPMADEYVVGEGDGLITVTIGGGSARAAVAWAETLDSKNLIHRITVSGGKGGPYVKDIPAGGGAVNFSVTPGLWTILVQAYYLGDLVAEGSETKQIKQGNNGYISIKMQEPSNYPSYTVSFDSNGGSAVSSQTVKKYSRAARPASDPANSNQYFIDWYTESACINRYSFGDAVTGNITLYAGWSASTPYTVTFDKNGGDTEASPTSRNAASGGTVALPTAPTRRDYNFVEWNTKADGTGTAFTASTIVTEDITVYAKWTYAITVTFEMNDGSGTTHATKVLSSSGALGAANFPGDPTPPSGMVFAGWNTASDGSGSVFTASITVTTSITVYAKWLQKVYIAAIPDVTPPVADETAVTSIATSAQYTGTVVWDQSLVSGKFKGLTTYTATITLTAKSGFTLDGVALNFFQVAGTSSPATNPANTSNAATVTVTAVFPATGYAIGDTGPGGGKIFYVDMNGFNMTGIGICNYLEAAPNDVGGGQIAWASTGHVGQHIGTDTALGTGKSNTALILATDPAAPAALACDSYSNGGKSDWFFPSKDELNELYKNRSYVGNFNTTVNPNYYWSSSEGYNSNMNNWNGAAQYWMVGNQSDYPKGNLNLVRPIRAF